MTISITLTGTELTRVKTCFGKIFGHADVDEAGVSTPRDATDAEITQHAKDWIKIKTQRQEKSDNHPVTTDIAFS